MDQLAGKVAMITGAASGIGQKTAQLMANKGATVVLTDIRDVEGEKSAAAIGSAASYISLDVTQEEAWKGTIDTVMEAHGHLDILSTIRE